MGVTEVLNEAYHLLSTLPEEDEEYEMFDFDEFKQTDMDKIEITVEDGIYFVEGLRVQNLVDSTNFDDYESLQYFQRALRKYGIIDKLEEAGINEGDIVNIYDFEFDYIR